MKLALKILGGLLGVVVAIFVLQGVASETGEVVVVTTYDAAGTEHTTRLWIVEFDGHAWLRSGAPSSGWFQRVSENSLITVERGNETFSANAVPVSEKRDPINELMRAKYGWADQYIALIFGRDDAVPLRLERRAP